MIMKCLKCGGNHVEEKGVNPGDYHWYLCRDCGNNWPTGGAENETDESADSGADG